MRSCQHDDGQVDVHLGAFSPLFSIHLAATCVPSQVSIIIIVIIIVICDCRCNNFRDNCDNLCQRVIIVTIFLIIVIIFVS